MERNRLLPILLATLMWSFLSLLIDGVAYSGEVVSSNVQNHGGRFDIYAEVLIALPEPKVRAILSRYENLPEIYNGIKRVQILEQSGSGQTRMKVASEVCIFFICLDYSWVQDVNTLPSGEIVAIIDPERSNFQEGRALWRFIPESNQTRLIFDAHLIPDFWFPPVIGSWLIRRKLRNAALKTALGVERLAVRKNQANPKY